MIARAAAILLSLALPAAAAPGTPDGLWLTQDRGGVIAVSACGDRVCGRIVGIVLDRPSDPTPLDAQGVSQCGLTLFDDLAPVEPDLWRGHIRDPRNGSVWGAQLWVNPDGTLSLRGFAGIALFGRTETWTRYPGTVPADCRIAPADVAAAIGR